MELRERSSPQSSLIYYIFFIYSCVKRSTIVLTEKWKTLSKTRMLRLIFFRPWKIDWGSFLLCTIPRSKGQRALLELSEQIFPFPLLLLSNFCFSTALRSLFICSNIYICFLFPRTLLQSFWSLKIYGFIQSRV